MIDQVISHLKTAFSHLQPTQQTAVSNGGVPFPPSTPTRTPQVLPKMRRTVVTRIFEAVKAIALCHNVTPVYEVEDEDIEENGDIEADQQSQQQVVYQASSPDEVSQGHTHTCMNAHTHILIPGI